MKVKFYLSDEGYGHIVRQRAILEELLKYDPEIVSTLQTHTHYDFAKSNVPANHFIQKFNNIKWHKNEDSSPDLNAIHDFYSNYEQRAEDFIVSEKDVGYNFILTDFVYEAIEIGRRSKTPVFGVGHFTWDWFFSKLYPRVISDKLFKYFTNLANSADMLFFPPMTPEEILRFYKGNSMEVPFIIRSGIVHRTWPVNGKFKVLIMDSGSGLMRNSIIRALGNLKTQEVTIGLLGTQYEEMKNVFSIPSHHLLVDYVRDADSGCWQAWLQHDVRVHRIPGADVAFK